MLVVVTLRESQSRAKSAPAHASHGPAEMRAKGYGPVSWMSTLIFVPATRGDAPLETANSPSSSVLERLGQVCLKILDVLDSD